MEGARALTADELVLLREGRGAVVGMLARGTGILSSQTALKQRISSNRTKSKEEENSVSKVRERILRSTRWSPPEGSSGESEMARERF